MVVKSYFGHWAEKLNTVQEIFSGASELMKYSQHPHLLEKITTWAPDTNSAQLWSCQTVGILLLWGIAGTHVMIPCMGGLGGFTMNIDQEIRNEVKNDKSLLKIRL